MKKTIPRFLLATLLIISIMLSVACDKTDTPPEITDVTSSSGGEMMTVPKESAMALKTLLDSDEMMYKFSYIDIEPDDPVFGKVTVWQSIGRSETWDRRLILTGILLERAIYIYDPATGECETFEITEEDADSDYTYGQFLIPKPDGGYVTIGKVPDPDVNKEDCIETDENGVRFIREDSYTKPAAIVLDSSFNVTGFHFLPEYMRNVGRSRHSFDRVVAGTDTAIDKDGYMYFYEYREKKIHVFSPEFEHLFELDRPAAINQQTFLRDNDGNIYFGHSSETPSEEVYYLRSIDIENQRWSTLAESKSLTKEATRIHGETIKIPTFGGGLDCYYVDKYGIIGRNDDEDTSDLLFEWHNLGIDYDLIQYLTIYSPRLILLCLYEPETDLYRYGKVELVPVSSVYGEQGKPDAIRIAADRSNNSAAQPIIDHAASFIRGEKGCPVEIVAYSDEGGLTANQQLLRDISSGNAPDLVIFGGGLSYEVLSKSGIFTDLYGVMKDDPDFSADDLLDCVREPFERDGKLERLVYSFSLADITGSKSDIKSPATVDSLRKLNSKLGNGQYLTYVVGFDGTDSGGALLGKLLPYMLDSYVDYDKKTLDKDALGELLTLCKEAKVTDADWIFVDPNLFRDKTIALNTFQIFDPGQFLLDRYANFSADDLVYAGYPETGTACVCPYNSFALLKASKNPTSAWELVKHLLSSQAESYSTVETKRISDGSIAFPATKVGLDQLLERVKKVQFGISMSEYTGKNGKKSFSVVFNPTDIDPENGKPRRSDFVAYNDADIKALKDRISSARGVCSSDAKTIAIIKEEAAYFFQGSKPLDETLKLINDRVTLRLSE